MLIERLEAVTHTREATANAIAEQMSITIAHRRRELEQGMENLTPVVVDAKDPEQETELSHSRGGGVER